MGCVVSCVVVGPTTMGTLIGVAGCTAQGVPVLMLFCWWAGPGHGVAVCIAGDPGAGVSLLGSRAGAWEFHVW